MSFIISWPEARGGVIDGALRAAVEVLARERLPRLRQAAADARRGPGPGAADGGHPNRQAEYPAARELPARTTAQGAGDRPARPARPGALQRRPPHPLPPPARRPRPRHLPEAGDP